MKKKRTARAAAQTKRRQTALKPIVIGPGLARRTRFYPTDDPAVPPALFTAPALPKTDDIDRNVRMAETKRLTGEWLDRLRAETYIKVY